MLHKKYLKLIFPHIILCFLVTNNLSFASTLNSTQEPNHFSNAKKLLEKSNLTQQQSSQAILEANTIRKKILSLRSEIRKSSDKKEQKTLTLLANKLTADLKINQAKGSDLRKEKQQLKEHALSSLEEGMVEKWGANIKNRNPILMGDSTALFFAHNTKFRSIHPKMLNKMGSELENRHVPDTPQDMSLLVPALAGQNAPPELDISSFQLSREQTYFSHIEVKVSDKPSDNGTDLLVPPNTIHKWLLMLSDINGKPIEKADIDIVGHMPGHVHGLPTQPRVTKEISPGIYQVEGVKFQMKGWWVMQFNIESKNDNKADAVIFNLVL